MKTKYPPATVVDNEEGRATPGRDGGAAPCVAQDSRSCEDAPLSCAAVEVLAERFRTLAEPMRVRIVDELREGPRCVSELAAVLGTAQPNVSRHLQVLDRAGIIRARRDGNLAFYSICDESVLALLDSGLVRGA